MVNIRVVGLVISLGILFYAFYKYRQGSYRRLDLIIGLAAGIGVGVISVSPAAANSLTTIFGLQNRLFAILVFTNFVLFGLFLYVLNKANHANRLVGDLVRALAKSEYFKTTTIEKESKSIFIVIPAYNEEQAIAGVLKELPKQIFGYQVYPIVVVDGVSDDTEKIVRRENHLVASHVMNRGQGDALRTGFEIAIQHGADIVITMDADGQHQPKDIERLVKPLADDQADYVMGSRFLGEYEDQGGVRHLGIVLFTKLINLLAGTKITDCTNGFRAIQADRLAELRLTEDKFSAPELIMEAARKGLRIKEVPVTVSSRTAGESKKPRRLGYPLGFLRTIMQVWLR